MDQENWLTSRPQSVLIMYILCENIYFTPSLNLLLLELYRVITGVAFRNDKDILTICLPGILNFKGIQIRLSKDVGCNTQTGTNRNKVGSLQNDAVQSQKLTPGSIFCHDLTDFLCFISSANSSCTNTPLIRDTMTLPLIR